MKIRVETDTLPRYRGRIVGYTQDGSVTLAVVLIMSTKTSGDRPAWTKEEYRLEAFSLAQLIVLEVADV